MYRNLTADHLQKTSIVSYIKYVRDTGKTFVIRNSNKNIRLWLVLLAMQHGFALNILLKNCFKFGFVLMVLKGRYMEVSGLVVNY